MCVEKRETANSVCVHVCAEDNATGKPSSAPGFGTEECCAAVVVAA